MEGQHRIPRSSLAENASRRRRSLPIAVEQPSLFRADGDPRRRPRADLLVPRLLDALDGRGWVNARRLARELEVDDRALREAASQSRGRIIGGQSGYARTDQVSPRESGRVSAALRSQAKKMLRRSIDIDRVSHATVEAHR